MNKEQLRQLFLRKRTQLTFEQLAQGSQAVSQIFFEAVELSHIAYLHIFLPILRKHEMNTWLIIERLRKDYPQLTLVVPKIHWPTKEMESYVLMPHTEVAENPWGIPEPVKACLFPHHEKIDMVLLPLLCFDIQGFRVGYGKGFYDKFLKTCRKDVIKVGLSVDDPVDRIEELHAGDVKMDFCVTRKALFWFNRENPL